MTFRRLLVICAAILVVALPSPSHAGRTYYKRLWYGGAGDTTAVAMADSSLIFSTNGAGRNYLFLKPNKPCRIAIQVRCHTQLDTTSAVADSLTRYSFPFRAVDAGGTQADSTSWREVTAPVAGAVSEDEVIVQFGDFDATTGLKWWGTRGKVIPLRQVDNGGWMECQNMSIRLQVITSADAGVVTWLGSVIGFGP